MCHCVTDKPLERLKLTVTNYSDRTCWSLKPRSASRQAAHNLTEQRSNCISGDEVLGKEN